MATNVLFALLFWAVFLGVNGYAAWRGGRPERIGAAINVIGCIATLVVRLLSASAWLPAALSVLTIDFAVAAGFFWLAVRTTRFWPVWAFGFTLANLLVSIAAALLPAVAPFVYHTGLGLYAYLAFAALALGTMQLPRDAGPVLRNGFRSSWMPPQPK
ncbi:hypothetical protein ASG37_07055 [Sphingomonas sp. Leaf407]|uniref:hypothetical protein n=1 Tax=unclassified Sphingomonas TaxID=196159 RepID=UPI0006F7961F|nr:MULTISPECIES: hypothetical protein [unclassified Sphingomonas]KQN39334.1 hypothetical protein ASE97_04345 [Sphingomonas sp. Leaf42]KQT28610.1 hypothetical protein ASG37_07055 [Sphingomonas sp. Leaf407]